MEKNNKKKNSSDLCIPCAISWQFQEQCLLHNGCWVEPNICPRKENEEPLLSSQGKNTIAASTPAVSDLPLYASFFQNGHNGSVLIEKQISFIFKV